MRKKIVAGNWKMNQNADEAHALIKDLRNADFNKEVSVIVAPPSIYLGSFSTEDNNFSLASQNVSHLENGAHTGEVSASMLRSINVEFVIIGHSERRQDQNESDNLINLKLKAALNQGVKVILCCGESLETRESGAQKSFVLNQLDKALANVNPEEMSNVTIAYEPIWAIGTGVTASSDQAQEMHADIRSFLNEKYNGTVDVSILYGGSCKPANAKELFSQPDIDGGLIGGASLKADSFCQLTHSF